MRPAVLALGIAVGAGAVVLAAGLHRSGLLGANELVGAVVLAIGLGAVVVLAVVAGPPVDRSVVVASLGVGVTIVGSGVGRWQGEERLVGSGGGDVVRASARLWPLVGLGVLVVGAGVVDGWRRRRTVGSGRVAGALAGLATEALGFAVLAATVGDVVVGQWIEGRPRRHRGRLTPDQPVPGTSSYRSGTKTCRERGVAAIWTAAARDEAAAVDAFAALAARLERVGAPADLVARSRAAAADEVRHAGLCRRLATRHGSSPELAIGSRASEGDPITGSGRWRWRTVEVVRLAVESYVDGVVGEGAAAGRLERGAATAPDLAPTLAAIARDERDHAALGADVVRWCAGRRPRLVTAAVRAAARRVPARTALPPAYAGVEPAALRAAGLVDGAGAAEVWAAERRTATAALADLVPQGRGRGPAQ